MKSSSANQAAQVLDEILAGTSDDAGWFQLKPDELKNLDRLTREQDAMLWVVADGHAQEFHLLEENDDWSDAERMHHALDAMAYTDRAGIAEEQTVGAFLHQLSQSETQSDTAQALLTQLRKS
ncbi:hypothetical protein [Roseateles koreensis]|uniref:Uncharacterized protein n=1 Tax=Roseateles koreensis TaxID=2987526 RepID=A0ABT5KSA2_9BURK|nr:hypothetical protein [Roseateles koreensis]MDC8785315.1 hypothetical protein [Roseateles koreensis]